MIRSLIPALTLALLPAVSNAARPNVLMIVVDDLNDWVGCLPGRHPHAVTPNIDHLAAAGTLFTNAHAQAPLCNPSRTSVLSGLRPSTTGVYGLAPGPRQVPILKDHVMLPQTFARAGYFTACFGKVWHDGAIRPEQKADEFEVFGPAPGEPVPAKKFVNTPSGMKVVDWGVMPGEDRQFADWKTADNTLAQIKTVPKDRPFFIAAGFRMPHLPCFATRKWFDLYPEDAVWTPDLFLDDRNDVPEFAWYLNWKLPEPRLSWLAKNDQWKPLVRAYQASTSFMDSQVGRVLEGLAESDRADDTVVVLWSDHGWHIGEKGISGKNSLWERSTHVPLIFAGPGIVKGADCPSPAELLDIYPTLLELADLPAHVGLEGHSLLPQLKDAKAARPWPAITTANADNHAVRDDRWRYIRYADGSEELYDMTADPHEWTNLAADPYHAEEKARLAQSLPASSAAPAPGSAQRTLVRDGAGWRWEGKLIDPAELEQ